MYELNVEAQFDSAHNLRNYHGSCENLHGHTYRVMASYQGAEVNDLGMAVDFRELKGALCEIVDAMDHAYLNDLPEFTEQNPTAELIAKVIFHKLRASIGEGISKVTVWETPTSSASYWE